VRASSQLVPIFSHGIDDESGETITDDETRSPKNVNSSCYFKKNKRISILTATRGGLKKKEKKSVDSNLVSQVAESGISSLPRSTVVC
jgi:hypothetical protein